MVFTKECQSNKAIPNDSVYLIPQLDRRNRSFMKLVYLCIVVKSSFLVLTGCENVRDKSSLSATLSEDLGNNLKPPVLEIVESENKTLVFDQLQHPCIKDGARGSDAPLRAIRDGRDILHLFMPNVINMQLYGTNYNKLKLDCNPVLISRGWQDVREPQPHEFDDAHWLGGLFYSAANDAIFAYTTADWREKRHDRMGRTRYPSEHNKECWSDTSSTGKAKPCWYSGINSFVAELAGSSISNPHVNFNLNKSASKPSSSAVAVFPKIKWDPETSAASPVGFKAPSNIFAGYHDSKMKEPYFYMFVHTSGGASGQERGVCLLRTKTPEDNLSWQAYRRHLESAIFDVKFKNPYSDETNNERSCTPINPEILKSPIRSVLWHPQSKHYIAIVYLLYNQVRGLYYLTSKNLINWSEPIKLLAGCSIYTAKAQQRNQILNEECDLNDYGIDYPSLIDWAHRGHNFDTLVDEGSAFLYYIQIDTKTSMREVFKRRVHVTNY